MANFLGDIEPRLTDTPAKPRSTMFNNPENTKFGTLTVRSSWAGVWTDDNFTREEIGKSNTDDLRGGR